MDPQTIVFWFILDPITFGLGSIGAYLIFHEIADLEHFPSFSETRQIFKRRWLACLFLAIAVSYFFFRLFSVLKVAGGTAQ
jgi:hypothetical protein